MKQARRITAGEYLILGEVMEGDSCHDAIYTVSHSLFPNGLSSNYLQGRNGFLFSVFFAGRGGGWGGVVE